MARTSNGRFAFWSVLIGGLSLVGSVLYAIVWLYVAIAEQRQALKEIETQFCASDDVTDNAYYPKICQAGNSR